MANASTSSVTYSLQVWGWAWLSGWGCLGKMKGLIKDLSLSTLPGLRKARKPKMALALASKGLKARPPQDTPER